MIRNSQDNWGSLARGLHWLLAVLIFVQAVLGWIAHEMDRSPGKITLMTAHKSLGITILMLIAVRLAWRWINPTPDPPPGSKSWEILLARLTHAAIYLSVIGVALSGWLTASTSIIAWKFWWAFQWPRLSGPNPDLHELSGEVHETLVTALAGLLIVHTAAAFKHHFIDRDQVLLRMWKG